MPELVPLTDEWYVQKAREKYEYLSDGDVDIDENPTVSASDNGAYVAAWVWVPNPEPEDTAPSLPIWDGKSSGGGTFERGT